MKVLRPSVHPGTITSGFIGLLLTTVAALVIWPFCRPLLWLLFTLLAVFFLFAFVVISFSFLIIFQLAKGMLLSKVGKSSKAAGRIDFLGGAGTAVRSSGLWDEWLDGV